MNSGESTNITWGKWKNFQYQFHKVMADGKVLQMRTESMNGILVLLFQIVTW
jgi:hypothetical protein